MKIISRLTSAIDEILDYIDGTAARFSIYKIRKSAICARTCKSITFRFPGSFWNDNQNKKFKKCNMYEILECAFDRCLNVLDVRCSWRHRPKLWLIMKYMIELGIMVYSAIAAALFFDFANSFHDSANSIATVVGTKVLKPVKLLV